MKPKAKSAKKVEKGLFDSAFAATSLYDRHLTLDHVVRAEEANPRERFEAIARTLRDALAPRWLATRETHDRENAKRVCYLSMEFLIGRTLVNNIVNLGAEGLVRESLASDP